MLTENATAKLLNIILRELDVKVTQKSINEEVQRYPDPESLLGISDILNTWKIPNAAYHLSVDDVKQSIIPIPFLACFKGDSFALVHEINEKKVITTSSVTLNKVEMGITDFEDYYSGVVLAFQKDELSGEINYSAKRRKEIVESLRVPTIILASVLLISIFVLQNKSYINAFDWQIACVSLFKIAGFITSIILLMQSIDSNNPLIQKFCGTDSNKSCNAILLSDAAKITDELSWSEVGFFYFTGSFLSLLIDGSNENLLHYLAILNILCLPYTIYSIYYQWQIAKQWCIFCCTIQVTLWFEFIPLAHYLSLNDLSIDVNAISDLIIGFILPIIIWVFIKPYLRQESLLKSMKGQLHRFKYNTQLFNALLKEETGYELLSADQSIILGNLASKQTVTIISNPMCKHCAKAHQILEEWLDKNEDNKLQVIFSINDNKNSNQFKAAHHLLYLHRFFGIGVEEAISDWFGQKKKNYEDWSKKYPPIDLSDSIEKDIKAQSEWCKLINVTHTPMILINGHRLPSVYQLEDVKYILGN